ncbi:MAG: cobalamin-binding protein [Candidatus Nanohaloarchaea archaeon]
MRIASLAPSNTEIICELGAAEELVATTSLCDHEEAVEKPSVGGWTGGIDFDRLEGLEPDIVLTSDDLQDEAVEKLEARGLESLHLRPHTLEEVFESIKVIGRAVDRPGRAARLVDEMKKSLEEVDFGGARIYCEEWSRPPMVSGNWIIQLVKRCGGEYFIEKGRSREFDDEALKAFDPEHIFLNICGAGEKVSADRVLEREDWRDIAAVQNKNVHVVDDSLLNRPSPSLVEGAQEIERKVDEG